MHPIVHRPKPVTLATLSCGCRSVATWEHIVSAWRYDIHVAPECDRRHTFLREMSAAWTFRAEKPGAARRQDAAGGPGNLP